MAKDDTTAVNRSDAAPSTGGAGAFWFIPHQDPPEGAVRVKLVAGGLYIYAKGDVPGGRKCGVTVEQCKPADKVHLCRPKDGRPRYTPR